jgi:hypothetical protein
LLGEHGYSFLAQKAVPTASWVKQGERENGEVTDQLDDIPNDLDCPREQAPIGDMVLNSRFAQDAFMRQQPFAEPAA